MPPKRGKGKAGDKEPREESGPKIPTSLTPQFNEVVRDFTQRMMNRGIVGKRGAFALLADLLEAPHTRPLQAVLTLRTVLEEVNRRVAAYGFAVRTVRSDVDGKLFYAFVNTEDDEIAHQAAKSRDDWQFNLLKWFIGQVTENGSGFLTRHEVAMWPLTANLARKPTAAEAEGAIDRLLCEGWLVELPEDDDRSRLVLGPRALAEMKETLRGVMSPEARCPRCREVVVYGIDLEYKNATTGETELRRTHIGCNQRTGPDGKQHPVGEAETGANLPIAELKTQGGGKAWARVVRDGGAEIASSYAGTAVGSALLASSDVRVARHGVSAYLSAGSYSGSSSSAGAGAGAGAAAGGRGRGRAAAATSGRGRRAGAGEEEDSDSGRSDEEDGAGGGAGAAAEEDEEGGKAGTVSGRKRGRPQRASRAVRKRYTDDAAEDDSDAEGGVVAASEGESAGKEGSDADEGAGASSAGAASTRGASGKSVGKKGFRGGASKRLRKAAAEEASDSDGRD